MPILVPNDPRPPTVAWPLKPMVDDLGTDSSTQRRRVQMGLATEPEKHVGHPAGLEKTVHELPGGVPINLLDPHRNGVALEPRREDQSNVDIPAALM